MRLTFAPVEKMWFSPLKTCQKSPGLDGRRGRVRPRHQTGGYLDLIMWLSTRGGRKKLQEQIEASEKRLEGLETGARAMKLEWEMVYDKLNRLMGRLNARIRKSEQTEEAVEEPDNNEPQLRPRFGTHAQMNAARMRRGLLPR